LFISHCFKGAYMGRTTNFRLRIIKVRFCKALLTRNDVDRDGIVSFRSQWDVASLAGLIYTLGLRDEEDAEFWNSFVNVGHIEEGFAAKAQEMIDLIECDGPLLIFCQLGRLAASAVPLNQSGPDRKDVEKVWELLRKVIEDNRLPLDHASNAVWKEQGQLRQQVNDLCGKYTGDDKEFLERLLRMIDSVFHLRFSDSEGPPQRDAEEEQGSKSLVSVISPMSSGEPNGTRKLNRFSDASGSTAVARGPSSVTHTSEGDGGLERTSPFINFSSIY
jgi:hypothetical protein